MHEWFKYWYVLVCVLLLLFFVVVVSHFCLFVAVFAFL